MTADELRHLIDTTPCLDPQLFLYEAANARKPIFAFVVRFPGNRVVALYDRNVPSTHHHIDVGRSSYYRDKVLDRLREHRRNGDANLVAWTNWVSMNAAIGGIIRQFNAAQEKRMRAEYPIRWAVRDAMGG